MSRKRDREKRLKRMRGIEYRRYARVRLPVSLGDSRICLHAPDEYIAAGWCCPDVKAGKPDCNEIPF